MALLMLPLLSGCAMVSGPCEVTLQATLHLIRCSAGGFYVITLPARTIEATVPDIAPPAILLRGIP